MDDGTGSPQVVPVSAPAVADEVDRIVAAWRRERPDLDVSPLEVLSRVTRLARHLDRARRGAFARHGLETWEFDVLSALRRAGLPYELSPGALLTQTLVTSGTMTNRIDRLEDHGLVSRRPSPGDRRGVLVRLTESGLTKVDAAMADLVGEEHAILASLDRDQRVALATLLHDVLGQFDA
ncbi:MarR family winged helix-turn-helix transcriptional regulator [Sanguibacter sp. A247]|uniref:MarR family winged helix-turn-helix transcriptional regulator n=1 Tax=unclassified Sanguibacter TaxID=2645534 RepID=UPI003FD71625